MNKASKTTEEVQMHEKNIGYSNANANDDVKGGTSIDLDIEESSSTD